MPGHSVTRAKAQRAKELRRQMTPEEALVWQQLRANRLHGYHFRRQHIIEGFIVDFYCHAARLVVEIDGEIHRMQPDYDHERDAILTGQGLHVVRITNEEVRADLEAVLERIVQTCSSRC